MQVKWQSLAWLLMVQSAWGQAAGVAPTANTPSDRLNATLWQQTAVEYTGAAEGAYRAAQRMLDLARKQRRWTAAPEQQSLRGSLPPAVILDIDETVLDNSAFQARMLDQGLGFDPAQWDRWVEEAAARAVPGAVAFTQYAARKGVAVYYVTNREARGEAATRRNLERLGFPLEAQRDTLLCRGERPEWGSDKGTRRAYVAQQHRILLLIGDDLGDFLSSVRTSVTQRRTLAEPYQSYWGERWFLIPNAQYGSWEDAPVDNPQGLSEADKRRKRWESLRRE